MVARVRDASFLPLGKLPGGSGHMLRILSGTQHGWFGKLALQPDFLKALSLQTQAMKAIGSQRINAGANP